MRVFRSLFVLRCILLVYAMTALVEPTNARRKSRTHRSEVSQGEKDTEKSTRRNKHHQSDFLNSDGTEEEDDNDADEWTNLSTNNEIEETGETRRKRIDPKRSWMSFVRYTGDRASENKPNRRKRKRNRKNRSKELHGPPGPPGPQGPPGPPGPSISKEEIIAELQQLIAETAERRAQEMFADMLASTNRSVASIPMPERPASEFLSVPRIYAGFSMHLTSKSSVRRKTYMEMKSFKQPFGSGTFQRGTTFNTKEGRFVVPRDGVYQFSAGLHLRVRTKRKSKHRTKDEEYLRVVICIDSLCKTNTSLETITGIDDNRGTFTVRASGILFLKENQYVSVYVDNSSTYRVVVLQGSEYTGIFMGV